MGLERGPYFSIDKNSGKTCNLLITVSACLGVDILYNEMNREKR